MDPSRTGGILLFAAAVAIPLTGFVLRRQAPPYGALPLNLHKLTALAAAVYLGLLLRGADRAAVPWALVGAAATLLVAAVGTGGALSAVGSAPHRLARSHRALSWAALLLTAVLVVLF